MHRRPRLRRAVPSVTPPTTGPSPHPVPHRGPGLGWLGRGVSDQPHSPSLLDQRALQSCFSAHVQPSGPSSITQLVVSPLAWVLCQETRQTHGFQGGALAELTLASSSFLRPVPTASLPGGLLRVLQRPDQMVPSQKNLPLYPWWI